MKFFGNLKIVYKILTLVCLLLLITSVISYVGFDASKSMNAMSDEQETSSIDVNMGHVLYEQAMAMNTTTDDISADPSKANIEKNTAINVAAKAMFSDYLPKLAASADDKQKAMLDKIQVAYNSYLTPLAAVFQVVSAIDSEKTAESQTTLDNAMKASEAPNGALKDALKDYVAYSAEQSELVAKEAKRTYGTSSQILLFSSIAALVIGLGMGFLIAIVGISRPLKGAVRNLTDLIAGDLNIEIKNADRRDEVGDVAKAAQAFKEVLIKNKEMVEAEKIEIEKKAVRQGKIQELIANFDTTATQTVATVASASTQLSQTAENMSLLAGNTNQQSIEVASASEQASHNVQSVASAAEEMAATVQEISRQISMSNDIVRNAQQKAEEADNSSRELVDMSKSVGTIATLIEDIAGQINLLALNATIESARSGEAGKGFAVVANEVKNLATQTAKATEQIRQQLDAVQKTAVGVADLLGGVRHSIDEVSQSSAAIAAAVEEQSAATHEIVSNMNTATRGVEQINNGILSIKGGTDSTTAATGEVLNAARMLSSQAEKMDSEVKTFLMGIQAA